MTELASKRAALLSLLGSFESCAVAYSGGVDSALLAKAAYLALGSRAVAVTGVSPSLARAELESARELARQIGIRHVELSTAEFDSPQYTRNAPDRCYHCKSELYTLLASQSDKLHVQVVLNGANLDDLGDYRPGMQAAAEHAVRSPLVECGFTKADVRELAAEWELSVWDKPASPCLASRIAYGSEVTPERVEMIERAESFLRERGFRVARVRYHEGDVARLEVPPADLPRLCEDELRGALCRELRAIGFKFVTLDLEGFRSGSLNVLVPLASMSRG